MLTRNSLGETIPISELPKSRDGLLPMIVYREKARCFGSSGPLGFPGLTGPGHRDNNVLVFDRVQPWDKIPILSLLDGDLIYLGVGKIGILSHTYPNRSSRAEPRAFCSRIAH